MRNALRDLYDRQMRHHQYHVYNLDVPGTHASEPRVLAVATPNAKPVDQDAAALESWKRLEEAMTKLSPRMRKVTEGIRESQPHLDRGVTGSHRRDDDEHQPRLPGGRERSLGRLIVVFHPIRVSLAHKSLAVSDLD